jgi:hypothetical protein
MDVLLLYKEFLPDEILDLLEGDRPTLLQRRPIDDRILSCIFNTSY